MTAAMARKTVDEPERQFGKRAHIEIDHAELLVAVERRSVTHQAEAGIVDDEIRLELEQFQLRGDLGRGVALLEIGRKHQRARPPGFGNVVGERIEPVGAPRHQHEFMPVRGKDPRQFRADAGGSAREQGDRLHAPLLPSSSPVAEPSASSPPIWRRNSMRSRCDTPRRSAARHTRLSSSSSRLPSA